jgi:hypothetical protein
MGVWSYVFVEAQTHDGRKLRLMTLIDEFTRSPPFGASENLTIPRHTGHAVQIEPNLRSQSPKNGNISSMRRRLSAFSPQSCANLESGDRLPIRKNSQLAGVYAICDYTISSCWTGWLRREDSNLDMANSKSDADACPRGAAEPHFTTIHKSLETFEFREPYRIRRVQSSGDKWPFGEE